MRKLFAMIGLVLISQSSLAAGFHTCTGEVTRLVTRATGEGTQVNISGMNGSAKLGFGGDSYSKLHDRQFSMLLSAQMSGKKVKLEFEDNSISCSDDHDYVLIRYVSIDSAE
ncbi:hypothetical protein [Microbulbifer sp. DLAB2-AA]|uniref:hypothetical protein n=1 Tax=Microbulbifer sp. DLAB2-AA TaxID=3243394 RepID=UPI004039C5AB